MTNDKKVAIVLGGTVPHAEVIKKLQRRGYYVILLDYLDNPVAKNVADEHVQESTLDEEAVLRVAKEKNADLVISASVDQANISSCYAMEKMGKYAPYSYETALNITNKGYMKKVMIENDIPTSDYIYIEENYNLDDINVTFPVMVKPADSNSSNGVKKANNKQELKENLDYALSVSRNKRAVVEGFVEGVEISVYCYILNGKTHLLVNGERLTVTDGDQDAIKCYSVVYPARISENAYKKAEEIASKIAEVFGFDNTPFFFQGMVKGDDIKVLEFAPRVAGGISFSTIQKMTGFDILEATIDSYTEQEVDFSTYHKPEDYCTVNLIYGSDGTFDKLDGMDRLLEEKVVDKLYMHKTQGSKLSITRASSSRVGVFITSAESMDEMVDKLEYTFNNIDVLDTDGKSIIRRDLSLPAQLKKIIKKEELK